MFEMFTMKPGGGGVGDENEEGVNEQRSEIHYTSPHLKNLE